jgi:hypothetical protein
MLRPLLRQLADGREAGTLLLVVDRGADPATTLVARDVDAVARPG